MSSNALQQVQEHLDSGDYYSAHQKARTTATRLLAPPRRNPPPPGTVLPYDAKAQDAASLLWDAARRLLEKGQVGSGVDLGVMLVDDVWLARAVGCSKEERSQSDSPYSCRVHHWARRPIAYRRGGTSAFTCGLTGLTISSATARSQDHPAHRAHWFRRSVEKDPDRRRLLVRPSSSFPCAPPHPAHASSRPRSWTAKTGSGPAGDVEIHQYLGETLYKGALARPCFSSSSWRQRGH